jgi:hypothetical protein
MIDDLDEIIRQLLVADIPKPYKPAEDDVKFDQPGREVTGGWKGNSRPVINCFLYDVRENNALRQYQWERLPGDNGGNHQAQRQRFPLRIDCSYLVTTWAGHPEDEHRLLSWCLWALARHPILEDTDLPAGSKLRGQPFPIQSQVAGHDKMTNPAEVWSSLENAMRPGLSYVVTLALQPWEPLEPLPIVRTVIWRTGQAKTLPTERQLTPDRARTGTTFICGTVWAKGEDGPRGQAKVKVTVKDTGLCAISGEKGRFAMGGLPPGEYTLVAEPPGGGATQKSIVVPRIPDPFDRDTYQPAADGDYDLVLP